MRVAALNGRSRSVNSVVGQGKQHEIASCEILCYNIKMKDKSELIFLGTGTSNGVPVIGCDCAVCRSDNPKNKRMRTSVYLRHSDGGALLVDCGPDFREQALRYHVTRADGVLITHSHFDHIGGIDELRQLNFIMKSEIPLYGLPEHLEEIRARVSYLFCGTQQGGGKARISLNAIRPFEQFNIAGFQIFPIPVTHGKPEILGYGFGKLVFITDASAIPAKSMELLKNNPPDILILNALRFRPHPTHFNLTEALDVAKTIGARMTYLVHMCHDVEHESVNATLPENIRLAYDGLKLEF